MRPIATICAVALLAIALSVGVTTADSHETAVVDRIEDGTAVLLIEEDGETTDQRVVDPAELPKDGRHEGAVLRPVGDGYEYNESETERRRSDAGDRFDRLAEEDDDPERSRFGLCRIRTLVRLGLC